MKKQITALLLSTFLLANFQVFAQNTMTQTGVNEIQTEHLQLPKNIAKDSPTNIVVKTPTLNTIVEYNVLEVSFAENYSTKVAKVGDTIGFIITNGGLRTIEGTQIVPEGAKLEAVVTQVIKPKSFNRSGKIYIEFRRLIMPDGQVVPFKAKLATKKEFLSRGKLNGWGKGLGTTLGAGAVGVGAGCGIGVAASAVIIGGFAIGLPVGIAVGALAGLATPGLHYKAKMGDKLLIQVTEDVKIKK